MNKKFFSLVLFVSVIICCQNLYAHNETVQKKEAEKKAAEDKQSSDNWDDFMSEIKAQEKTPNAENKPEKSESPNQ